MTKRNVARKQRSVDHTFDLPSNEISLLKILRIGKGLSQNAFAQKLGIGKSCVLRMERKNWERISFGDIKKAARVLGIEFNDLVYRLSNFTKQARIFRSSIKTPFAVYDLGKGVQLASYAKPNDNCFIGSLTLGPKKILPEDNRLQGTFLFYLILQGMVTVKACGEESVLREKEVFIVPARSPYELYNAQPVQKTVLLLFCMPSFLPELA